MEDFDDNNNINYQKISLNKNQINEKTQTKQNFNIETNNNSTDKSYSSPISSDSLTINSYYINEIKNHFFKKTEKQKIKGTLHKYINSSYFKKSLGTIPSNSEKILLNENKIKDRFSGSNSLFLKIKEGTPGVGTYNLNYDWNIKNKSVKMKSEEKRFSDFFKISPGVGQYNLDDGQKYQQEKDNLRYNNLYSKTKILFNNSSNKALNSNILCYEPKNLNDILRNKKNYNFCSYSGRNNYRGSKIPTLFDKINDNPGPGQYFNKSKISIKKKKYFNNLTEGNSLSKNVKSFLSEYFSDIKFGEDRPSFNLKQNGNKRENKVYNLEDIHKLNQSYKGVVIDEKAELEKKIRENQKNHSSQNLYFKIRQNYELYRIKNILGNDNGRPDLFYLAPDRWKIKKCTFKAPGPAYYYY